MTQKRRKFDSSFKLKVVQLIKEQGLRTIGYAEHSEAHQSRKMRLVPRHIQWTDEIRPI